MSHFTKIGGTGYQITGGKTKIGGTGYQITGGKTKIGGTNYNINFNNLTLSELFANASILGRFGGSSSWTRTQYNPVSFPDSDPYKNFYMIGIEHCSYFYIIKVLQTKGADDWYTLLCGDDRTSQLVMWISATGFYFDCDSTYTQLIPIYFPNLEEEQVDSLLRKVNVTILAERSSTSTSTISCSSSYISGSEKDAYMQIFYTGTGGTVSTNYFSVSAGDAPTTVLTSTGSRVFWRLSSSNYYLSSSGTSNSSLRAGSILKLSV